VRSRLRSDAALDGGDEPSVSSLAAACAPCADTLLPEESLTGHDTLLKDQPVLVAAVVLMVAGSLAWSIGWALGRHGRGRDDDRGPSPHGREQPRGRGVAVAVPGGLPHTRAAVRLGEPGCCHQSRRRSRNDRADHQGGAESPRPAGTHGEGGRARRHDTTVQGCGGGVYLNDGGAGNRLLTGVKPGDRWQLYLKPRAPATSASTQAVDGGAVCMTPVHPATGATG
jgi:hypothetical protein